MKIVTSVSGGKTSAYIAVNYPCDSLVFALVRTSDPKLKFKDDSIRKIVSDRIGAEFIGTLEDDTIIYTMLDLEQYLGKKINWVSGLTFDEVVKNKGGWLPSKLRRYCTAWMKIDPIFYWWAKKYNFEPVKMNIGYRFSEVNRAYKMTSQLNGSNLSEHKATFQKHTEGRHKGKNKWELIGWREPVFPLIDDKIFKDDIEIFWENKPVRFAERNNCVGCFHRSSRLLNQISKEHPEKFDWFSNQEGGRKGYWKDNISYQKIKEMNFTQEMNFNITTDCSSGFCGM